MSILLAALPLLAPLQTDLAPGVPEPVSLLYSPLNLESFAIEVPDDAYAMRAYLTGSTHPLDLDAAYFVDDEYSEHYYFAEPTWYDRELYIPVTEPFGLTAGTWLLDVMVPVDADDVALPERAETTLTVEFPEPLRGVLTEGTVVEVELTRSNALRAILEVQGELDPMTEYRVECYSPDADVDLMIGNPMMMSFLGLPAALAYTELNYESETLSGEVLEHSEVHVYAHNGTINRPRVDVRVRFTPVAADAPSLVDPIDFPELGPRPTPREVALAAAVGVFGPNVAGSGSVIHPSGLVLTSAHVVFAPTDATAPTATPEELEANTMLGNFAGFSTPGEFRATMPEVGLQLVDYRPDLDLALLRMVGTLDGRDVPAEALRNLPAVPLGTATELVLGDTLFTLGYPMTGGTGKFVSLSMGKGIFSGRARQLGFASLKTDAPMHSGTSGGMVLNADWELVGVPDMGITDSNGTGGLGFAVPVDTMPASWRRLATEPGAPHIAEVLAQLGSARLIGAEPLVGDDMLGLAQDLVWAERALAGGAGQADARAALAARLPESLGALVAFAASEPARAGAVLALARELAGAAELPATDELGPWQRAWFELRADPAAWADAAGLAGERRAAYLARLERALEAQADADATR